jgi:hypothetical protein
LYLCDVLLERLTQPFEHVPSARGVCIEAEDAVVGQRHLAWHRHRDAADQRHIGHGLVGGRDTAGW